MNDLCAAKEAFEKTVIRALLTPNMSLLKEADRIAIENNFTAEMVIQCQANVERWLRLHGIGKLLPHESQAVLKIQANVRRWEVRSKLRKKYMMLMNLARMDDIGYLSEAKKLSFAFRTAFRTTNTY